MTALLATICACTRSNVELGPVTRLNVQEGNATPFSWAYYTSITASGDQVAAAWMERQGQRNRDAVVRSSADRGGAWSETVVLNDPDYANTVSVVPKLVLLPGPNEMLAVWQTRRNEAGQKFVLTRRSTDFGRSFEPVNRLNTLPQAFLPGVATRADGAVLVAYSDERNVNRDIYANRSLDAGKTWMKDDVRVDTLDRTESEAPAVALTNDGGAHVLWEERPRRGRPHLLASSSRDSGASWSQPVRVSPPDLPASPIWPALAEAKGNLIAVWTGGISGKDGRSWVWMSTSKDSGATWSSPPTVFYEGRTHSQFQLLSACGRVYLVWHGGDRDSSGQIYFNASDDGGVTWRHPLDEPLRIDRAPSPTQALHPRIACDEDVVGVTWHEGRKRVLATMSRDGGATWLAEPVEIATTGEKEGLRYPQIAVARNAAYLLWEVWPDNKDKKRTLADVNKPMSFDLFTRSVVVP